MTRAAHVASLPPELLDVALALNPDDPLVCERVALLESAKTQE